MSQRLNYLWKTVYVAIEQVNFCLCSRWLYDKEHGFSLSSLNADSITNDSISCLISFLVTLNERAQSYILIFDRREWRWIYFKTVGDAGSWHWIAISKSLLSSYYSELHEWALAVNWQTWYASSFNSKFQSTWPTSFRGHHLFMEWKDNMHKCFI